MTIEIKPRSKKAKAEELQVALLEDWFSTVAAEDVYDDTSFPLTALARFERASSLFFGEVKRKGSDPERTEILRQIAAYWLRLSEEESQ